MTRNALPARTADPSTSHGAAAKAVKLGPRVRDAVYHVLQEDGALTHDELVAAYQQRSVTIDGWPMASPSSIRTRCSELVADKLVERTGESGSSSMGNRAQKWRAVSVQRNKTADQNGAS